MVAILRPFTRVIAGVQIPNSPILNASISFAYDNLPNQMYNHVMRTWLNGQSIINKLPFQNRSTVDEEVFGVASILHDMAWGQDPRFSSPNKRFEVDGANVARSFLQQKGGKGWNDHRLRVVWDAIALHGTLSIAQHKDFEVMLVAAAILSEFAGPELARAQFGDFVDVTEVEWESIKREFPRIDYTEFIKAQNMELCRKKPDTTYDNAVGDWGEKYLANYTRDGHRAVDIVESIKS